jgi:hypothetical protein
LQTTLISLDRTVYRFDDRPRIELQIKNVGAVAVKIPFSSNLADVQPEDPGQKFGYFTMTTGLWIGGSKWSTNAGGTITLHGNDDRTGTMLTLRPGEWVRIIATGKLRRPDDLSRLTMSGDTVSQSHAETALYVNETLLTASAIATVSRRVCLNYIQGSGLPIQIAQE